MTGVLALAEGLGPDSFAKYWPYGTAFLASIMLLALGLIAGSPPVRRAAVARLRPGHQRGRARPRPGGAGGRRSQAANRRARRRPDAQNDSPR